MPAVVDPEKCDGCGRCQDDCPSGAIKVGEKTAVVKAEDCIDCNVCEEKCPNKAVTVKM